MFFMSSINLACLVLVERRLCFIIYFRPCAMVVPDFELICEIMLVAEGFLDARALARKFITLYSLCKELLSKQVRAPYVLLPYVGVLWVIVQPLGRRVSLTCRDFLMEDKL